MMKILFVWTGVTAYMADCWRCLSETATVKIYIQEKRQPGTQFDHSSLLHGLDVTIVYEDERLDEARLRQEISRFSPDVLFIVGWRAKLSRLIASERAFSSLPKVLIFDLPFAWTPRKLLAPLVLRRYLKLFKACFVPGARAAEYARWLGFKDGQIQQGLFAIRSHNILLAANDAKDTNIPESRPVRRSLGEGGTLNPSPPIIGKGFLFVGRYVKEKRLDVLVKAYKRYRMLVAARNEEPWGLSCCGMGPDARFLQGVAGVCDLGFCQPEEVASLRLKHGALVLASAFDPWPLVMAEACVSGLPIICTEACGNHLELIRGNGIVCKTGDAAALAQAMLKIHAMRAQERLAMGQKGLELVKPYLSEAWCERVRECAGEVLKFESSKVLKLVTPACRVTPEKSGAGSPQSKHPSDAERYGVR